MNTIVLNGSIPSKKNSKIISCRGPRPMMFPSVKHREWHIDASRQLIGVKKIPANTPLIFTYFAPDRRKGDLSNKWQSVEDLFKDVGIIEDDNWYVLPDIRMKFGGVVSKDEAGGLIEY